MPLRQASTRAYLLTLLVLTAANAFVYKAVFAPEAVTATVFEAGKGRAVLVRMPHETLLIDTGPDASILRALGSSLPVWQREVTSVIITSTDSESRGGLPSLESRYTVGRTLRFGTNIPYGTSITVGDVQVIIPSPHMATLVRQSSMRTFASTTSAGIYPL
jgi:hypothetical protein